MNDWHNHTCVQTRIPLMQVRVRFNAEEAIDELLRLNLISGVERKDGAQHYAAMPPGEASDHLNSHWQQILLQRVDSQIQCIA